MRLIVFDVDGTLVDSQNGIVEAQGVAFAAFGLAAPSRERSLSVVGLSLREAFAELAGAEAPLDALAEAYKGAWTAIRGRPGFVEPLYPGVSELVRDLAARPDVVLGLATGKSRRGVERLLDEHGWRGTFATTQTADDHPSKPDPAMLRAAMAETGLPASRTTMVGDTGYDMAMAAAAGTGAIGVAWGFHDAAALLTSGAEAVAVDVSALRAFLDRDRTARPA